MAIGHNAALLLDNLVDTATLTASSAIADAPVSRLKEDPVARHWRSEIATAWVLVDHGEAMAIDTMFIAGLEASTYRFRLSNNDEDVTVDPEWDSGVLDIDQNHRAALELLETPIPARYWLIDLVHVAEPFVEAGRLADGQRFTFTDNFARGLPFTYDRQDRVLETLGRQEIVYPRPKLRTMEPAFPFITEADRDGFVEALARDVGTSRSILFAAYPAGSQRVRDAMWCRMTRAPALSRPLRNHWSTTLSLRERL